MLNRRGTVYAEYFIAAAAMAAATFVVWGSLQSTGPGSVRSRHEGLRNGIMGAIGGPCTIDASRSIVGC